jgi:DNA modification methylase
MAVKIIVGDSREQLKLLASESVHEIVTSPPYWGLRDYGVAGQIGLEETPQAFVAEMVALFAELRRVLRADGTLWLNLGDSYATGTTSDRNPTATGKHGYWENPAINKRIDGRAYGLKPKDLVGIPWMVAFALRADGWYLRQDIIWHKPNPMPESVTDRCTKAHEYLFLLSKSERYFYDADAIAEPASENTHSRGTKLVTPKSAPEDSMVRAKESWHASTGDHVSTRNKRSVWTVATAPFAQAHFATFPPALIEPAIRAGTSERGCCVACGTPWIRIVARSRSNESGSGRSGKNPAGKGGPNAQHAGSDDDIRNGPVITTSTLGWYPTCDHDGLAPLPAYPDKPGRGDDDGLEVEAAHDAATALWRAQCREVDEKRRALCEISARLITAPCTVLDPFGGAGTTALVADRNQRHAILIELNPEYAAMARRRIDGDAPLFAGVDHP